MPDLHGAGINAPLRLTEVTSTATAGHRSLPAPSAAPLRRQKRHRLWRFGTLAAHSLFMQRLPGRLPHAQDEVLLQHTLQNRPAAVARLLTQLCDQRQPLAVIRFIARQLLRMFKVDG